MGNKTNKNEAATSTSSLMMMITAFGAINECPCCHDKDYTDNNGNQKTIKRTRKAINAFM